MSLAERLRAVVRSGGSASQDPPYVPLYVPQAPPCVGRPGAPEPAGTPTAPAPANSDSVADVLGGEWREGRERSASADRPASAGLPGRTATRPRYLVVDRTYPAGHRLGRVAVADCLPPTDGLWPRLDLLMSRPSATTNGTASGASALHGRLVFMDLETTGLAGGAGTYAFLVGCGWFEGAAFRVRQFFLAGCAAERGLLEDVVATMGAAGALVTYNGKSFDVPLINTRFLFHRMQGAPLTSLPHLDMLHAARRLWGSAETGGSASQHPPYIRRPGSAEPAASAGPANMRRSSCRLTTVEQAVLGHVREGDVPGFEIPSRYFHYVRTGDAGPLEGVLEHNRLDLLALAMLTAIAARRLDDGAAGARTAREALGLGRLYERGGMIAEAGACFARAAGADRSAGAYHDVDSLTLAEALRAHGALCRRERRHAEAAEAWRRILALRGCPAHVAQEATEALAVHHEHRLRDLDAARQFAVQTLQFNISRARVQAAHHRLARIDRKLGGPPAEPIPLF